MQSGKPDDVYWRPDSRFVADFMDIEAVAHDTPEKIHTIAIDPEAGVTAADVVAISKALQLDGAAAEDAKTLFPTLYKAFGEKDMPASTS